MNLSPEFKRALEAEVRRLTESQDPTATKAMQLVMTAQNRGQSVNRRRAARQARKMLVDANLWWAPLPRLFTKLLFNLGQGPQVASEKGVVKNAEQIIDLLRRV